MRVLFTTQPAYGHFFPLVPLARELVASGHEVLVATAKRFCPVVEASGLRAVPAGMDWEETHGGMAAAFPALLEVPPEGAKDFVIGQLFAGVTAMRTVPDLLGICETWRPDVLVRENTEFGAVVVADLTGVPHVAVQAVAFAHLEESRESLRLNLSLVRGGFGLAPDLALDRLYPHFVISFVPPSLHEAGGRLPDTLSHLRAPVFDRPEGESLPHWVGVLDERPTVCMTLGTVFTGRSERYVVVIEGLADEPVNLVVTTGQRHDPQAFGPLPPNVHVERYVPQSLLFPHCAAVIHHGGSGTVLAALTHALPQVIVPMGADQTNNARRCRELGAARVISGDDYSPATVREAVSAVLHDDSYRRAAGRLRAEIAHLPPLSTAVDLLESLAFRRPGEETNAPTDSRT